MKRLFAAALALALLLSLSACAIPLFTESYSNPTEYTFREESPDGLPPGTYYIPYLITTTVQATGNEYKTEYIHSDTGNGPIPDGRVYTLAPADGGETRELRREDWTLDEHYNMLTHTVTVGSEVTESYTYELTYDDASRLVRRVCLSAGSEVYTEYYSYDADGNLIALLRGADGALELRRKFTYDETGRVLTEITYTAGGSITERKEHTYDDEKLSDTILTFNGADVCTARQIDYYNPAGYVSQTHILTPAGETVSITLYLPTEYVVYR